MRTHQAPAGHDIPATLSHLVGTEVTELVQQADAALGIERHHGRAARELGVDRVLCLVTLDCLGKVNGCRNYDGLEMNLLEAANVQFNRFTDILDDVMQVPAGRMVQ